MLLFFILFLCSLVLTILLACLIIQQAGPCFDVIMDSDEELFLTQNCFEQEVLEPILSWGCTIGDDSQNSIHEDFKEILS